MREEPLDFWTRQLKSPEPSPTSEPRQPRKPVRYALWGKRLLVLWAVSNVVCAIWHWHFDRHEYHAWECTECGSAVWYSPAKPEQPPSYGGRLSWQTCGEHRHGWRLVEPRRRFVLWMPWNWLSDVIVRPPGDPYDAEDAASPANGAYAVVSREHPLSFPVIPLPSLAVDSTEA